MRYLWHLAIKNWQSRPGRSAAATAAIALGVGTVVWVSCSYESVRLSISDEVVNTWLGKSHITIEHPAGHWGFVNHAIVDDLRKLSSVEAVACRLCRRVELFPKLSDANSEIDHSTVGAHADALGIESPVEYRFRGLAGLQGRLLGPGEDSAAMMESKLATTLGISLGDEFLMRTYASQKPTAFTLVGMFEKRRVASFQRPVVMVSLSALQQIKNEPNKVTIIDLICTEATTEAITKTAEQAKRIVAAKGRGALVSTALAKLRQLDQAREQTEFVLMMVASVALLTAFFIILTTMSMGLSERMTSMGVMRSIALTRTQMLLLTLIEVVPIGAIGVLLGIPVGLGLTKLATWWIPEYLHGVAISRWGMWLAVTGGMITAIGGALVPALQASRISPLRAVNLQAHPVRVRVAAFAALGGLVLISLHTLMIYRLTAVAWLSPVAIMSDIAFLYLGYGLLTPLLVVVGGRVVTYVTALLLGLRRELVNDQVGRAPWRGGGICCGLMVGLSLIIAVTIHSESIIAGWDFPKKIAGTFLWTRSPVPRSLAGAVRELPGVSACTVVTDVLCDIGGKTGGLFSFLKPKSAFVAGEPEVFLNMAKLEFLEGNLQDALAKLKEGGYVLLPPESATGFNLHVGDTLSITIANQESEFTVAGIVKSPALDIAAAYFEADSYLMLASAGSVLGSLDDLRDRFHIDDVTLFLINIDPEPTVPPPVFHQDEYPRLDTLELAGEVPTWAELLPEESADQPEFFDEVQRWLGECEGGLLLPPPRDLERYALSMQKISSLWADMDPRQRWELFREQLILQKIANLTGKPNAMTGSLRQLKEHIDADIREATRIFTAVPLVALLVAALGAGNLIMANVNSRIRQIALMRAVGATKWQIVRLVMAEAISLGILGSVIGVALGLHFAYDTIGLVTKIIGFAPKFTMPWGYLLLGIGFTCGVCLLAGILPARHAARSNIVEAMRAE